jgi:signal transduction histidine kinase
MIDDFYAEIERHPEARKVITGGPAQVERLKRTLLAWIRELFSGQYDSAYVVRRWRVGRKHVEIGLDQVYTNVALSRLRLVLTRRVHERWTGAAGELQATLGALNALLDLDLAQIEGVYQAEYSAREERLLQTERLAAIGQMMTGLAHESGNALARSQVCLEMLAIQVEDRPKALDLVERIQKAQDHLMQLYEEVRGYAAPLTLERQRVSLASVWRQAWGTLELVRKGRDVSLQEEMAGIDLYCCADSFRLQQVFRNILENALAACKDPVELTIACTAAYMHGKLALRIAVRDNGPGLNGEQRQRIFDPFFTTKTKGTGLGMAIAKRIVEAHGGVIAVGAGAAPGAEILLTLPREST